jgi:hypothetical protein
MTGGERTIVILILLSFCFVVYPRIAPSPGRPLLISALHLRAVPAAPRPCVAPTAACFPCALSPGHASARADPPLAPPPSASSPPESAPREPPPSQRLPCRPPPTKPVSNPLHRNKECPKQNRRKKKVILQKTLGESSNILYLSCVLRVS